ncbi:MAG: dienelactone hydrolase family protein [Conexibacter sp.]|nr:dienelactone hydrolase family protein [Conexibacter sp.]
MCFDHDSRPPVPQIAGAAISHERLTLTCADGTPFAAFAATPDGASSADVGVVVLPDVRGLYRFYEELALRFAERGMQSIAIDYFGRTAEPPPREEGFAYSEHVAQTTAEGIGDDVGAAVAELRARGATSIFTIGFCFGGRHSWLAAAGGHGLAGAIGFYGMPAARDGQPGPTQRAGELAAPILGLMAGEDQHITPDVVADFGAALRDAGVEHELVTYAGAPHSFFDRRQEQFAEASDDAWGRTLDFIAAHRRTRSANA